MNRSRACGRLNYQWVMLPTRLSPSLSRLAWTGILNPYQSPSAPMTISIPKVDVLQWCTVATKKGTRHRILRFTLDADIKTAKTLVRAFFVAHQAKILSDEVNSIEFDRGLVRPPSFTLGSVKPASRIFVEFESNGVATTITCQYDSQQFNICDQFGGPVTEIRALAKHCAILITSKPDQSRDNNTMN